MNLRKGVVTQVDGLNKKLQTCQVDGVANETLDNVEHFQQYGFCSSPVDIDSDGKGCEVVLADVSSSDMSTIIATDDRRYSPTTQKKGDVVLYSKFDTPGNTTENATHRISLDCTSESAYMTVLKVNGAKIRLKSDNTINISNANASVTVAASGMITLTRGSSTITMTGTTITIDATNVNINGIVKINGVTQNAD